MTRLSGDDTMAGLKNIKFEGKPIGHIFDLYLCGEILPPENYIDQFEIIRNAGENDVIRLHINSAGGDLSTAIQFNRVIQESQAQICASAEGYCMSAATMIFLAADMFEISDHCFFMFHNYSGGSFGKGGEMYDHIVSERKWSDKLVNKVYSDFLTPEEIKSILDNKDIWMDGEEVKIRLEKKIKKMNADVEKIEKALMDQSIPDVIEKKPSPKKKVAGKTTDV
jgi:ATP-dependent protease ClpP protease subunit